MRDGAYCRAIAGTCGGLCRAGRFGLRRLGPSTPLRGTCGNDGHFRIDVSRLWMGWKLCRSSDLSRHMRSPIQKSHFPAGRLSKKTRFEPNLWLFEERQLSVFSMILVSKCLQVGLAVELGQGHVPPLWMDPPRLWVLMQSPPNLVLDCQTTRPLET